MCSDLGPPGAHEPPSSTHTPSLGPVPRPGCLHTQRPPGRPHTPCKGRHHRLARAPRVQVPQHDARVAHRPRQLSTCIALLRLDTAAGPLAARLAAAHLPPLLPAPLAAARLHPKLVCPAGVIKRRMLVCRRLPTRRRCGLLPAPIWQLKPGGALLVLVSHKLFPLLLLLWRQRWSLLTS